ncbi:MAG: undecaprenyl-diphosphate phosphatase [Halanaerobiaceae bacterium]
MSILKYVILGIIQGLTEFLPISSSGHLVIFQRLLGFDTGQLTLNVFLHFATLIPVIIIFWDDIRDITLWKREKRYFTTLLIAGAFPTALIGFFLRDVFAVIYTSLYTTGFMLLITGLIIFLVEKIEVRKKNLTDFKYYNAFLVGIAQGLAILPGISRSGSTVAASLFQGLKREDAARFSFVLSIPVITGASLLEMREISVTGLNMEILLATATGMLAAALAGYLAIKYFLRVLKQKKLIIFSYYCWFVGILVLLVAGI